MSAQIVVVHPNPASRDQAVSTLQQGGLSVAVHDPVSLIEGKFRDEESPRLLIVGWQATEDMESLVQWLGIQAQPVSRLMLVVPRERKGEATGWLGRSIDDLICEPLHTDELLGRTRAVLKRPPVRAANRIVLRPFELDKAAHAVKIYGKTLDLAPTEFRLITFFLENPGRVFDRQQLLHGAWKKTEHVGQRTVDVNIRRLRKVLEPFGCADMIQTLRGFGYRFAAEPSFRN